VTGEARSAARSWVSAAGAEARDRRVCLVSSGETTVRVTGSGRGGRNQEFALGIVDEIAALNRGAALASFGTDGIDGPTDAAGAVIDADTGARAAGAGLVPSRFLQHNDAHAFFAALGDLIHTGPTGTNVGDLQILLLA
jgi:hydroxypyruvate reductase